MILILLELDYGFNDHDLMSMNDFTIFRCTLECWNQLEIIGTSLRNLYEKRGGMGSLGDPGALKGVGRQSLMDRDCPEVILQARHAMPCQTEADLRGSGRRGAPGLVRRDF